MQIQSQDKAQLASLANQEDEAVLIDALRSHDEAQVLPITAKDPLLQTAPAVGHPFTNRAKAED